MVKFEFDIEDLKGLREDLCVAQSALSFYGGHNNPQDNRINRLDKIVQQIDILRPIGPDGKHGGRHTEFCGCEDNPYLDLLNSWRVIPAFPMYELSGHGDIRPGVALDDYWWNRTKEISASHTDEGLHYYLWSDDQGFDREYKVSVSELIKDAFPELKKEN